MNPKTIEKLYNLIEKRYRVKNELERAINLCNEYKQQDATISGIFATQHQELRVGELKGYLAVIENEIKLCEIELGLNDHYAVKMAERIINGGV